MIKIMKQMGFDEKWLQWIHMIFSSGSSEDYKMESLAGNFTVRGDKGILYLLLSLY
jgi:hypothetical protein